MSKHCDTIEREISHEKEKARKMFKNIYKTSKEQKNRKEFLEETLEQVEVCYGMRRTLSPENVKELLTSKTLFELGRKARKFKF